MSDDLVERIRRDMMHTFDISDLPHFNLSEQPGGGHYTTPVNSIFNRHTTDIRTNLIDFNPMVQQSRKNLRDIISKHDNEVLGFLNREPSEAAGFAETIFRRFGLDATPINRQYTAGSISRELNVDSSLNEVVTTLNTKYKEAFDCSCNPLTLQGFMNGMKWMISEYKQAGITVFQAENNLNVALGNLDKLYRKLNLLQQLPENDALVGVYEAFEKYSDVAFKEANIETTYKELVEAYKKWQVLREIISVQQMFVEKPQEPICSICVSDPISHTISPCGHTFCTSCIKKMNLSCYICRGTIRDRVRLFFN
jgi:hypothetical protein